MVQSLNSENIPARLVLSGGGVRGFAHLGVVSALLESGITPTAYCGTSAGGVAAAMLCSGYHPEEIMSIMLAQKPLRFAGTAFNYGLLSTAKLEAFLEKLLPATFEELQLPLSVTTTDIITGKTIEFTSGKLIRVLGASCAIPGLFRPVEIDPYVLVDGGILNNLPVEYIPPSPGKIIGVHVNPVSTIKAPSSAFRILERTFHLAVFSNTEHRIIKTDCYIQPAGLAQIRVFDFSKIRQAYQIGYDFVHQNKSEILKQLSE